MKHNWIRLLTDDLNFIVYQKGCSGRLRFLKAMLSPSFICTFIYRTAHLIQRMNIPLFPRLLWWINFVVFGVDIDQRAKLYGALYFPHPMNICIGQHVVLMGNAKIMQGVTIGGNLGKHKQHENSIIVQPVLEGSIFIGISCIVAGPVFIKGNIFIGAQQIISTDLLKDGFYVDQICRELKPTHIKELGVEHATSSN